MSTYFLEHDFSKFVSKLINYPVSQVQILVRAPTPTPRFEAAKSTILEPSLILWLAYCGILFLKYFTTGKNRCARPNSSMTDISRVATAQGIQGI